MDFFELEIAVLESEKSSVLVSQIILFLLFIFSHYYVRLSCYKYFLTLFKKHHVNMLNILQKFKTFQKEKKKRKCIYQKNKNELVLEF